MSLDTDLNVPGSETAPAAPPKLAPDDPRLKLRRGRTLKAGPVIALALALAAVAALAVLVALESGSQSDDPAKSAEDARATARPAIVPLEIRDPEPQPSAQPPPTKQPPAAGDKLPVVPLPDEQERRSYVGYSSDEESPARQRQRRREEEDKARSAGVLFETGSSSLLEPSATEPRTLSPSDLADALRRSAGDESDPNAQDRKNAFLDAPKKGSNYLASTVQRPASPYQVQAGTIIPAVLITGINSDLPGPVIGQVRENVYDTVSGNHLLIPQGARLLANYDSLVAWGQERVLVCWNRLIFPNGTSLNLECMPAADLKGYAGLADDVDEHWGKLLKGAAIASLLAATTQAVAGNTTGYNPTVPQMWARNSATEMNSVGQQITRRNLNIQPTITVRPGFSVNLLVTKDMVIPPYSEAS